MASRSRWVDIGGDTARGPHLRANGSSPERLTTSCGRGSPDTADHLVHVYVSRLRKALGDEGRPILVTALGCQLVLERGQSARSIRGSRRRSEVGGKSISRGKRRLRVLALWRGPARRCGTESFAPTPSG